MKKFIVGIAVVLGLVALPISVEAQGAPATFYVSIGGSASLDQDAAIKSASTSLRFGIKTNLNAEGTWRLITEYNALNKPLKKDETNGDYIKSIDIGVERLYWLPHQSGWFANSAVVLRGALDIEMNRDDNDNNLSIGFGWLKKLSADRNGFSSFSIEPSFDILMRDDEEDDIALFLTFHFTPSVASE